MIELKKIVTNLNYYYIMPNLITVLAKPAIKKSTKQKQTTKQAKTKTPQQKLNI